MEEKKMKNEEIIKSCTHIWQFSTANNNRPLTFFVRICRSLVRDDHVYDYVLDPTVQAMFLHLNHFHEP